MRSTAIPIKDAETLQSVLTFLKERSLKYYIIAVLSINTGVHGNVLFSTELKDFSELSYTNPSNGFRYVYDAEFATAVKDYLSSLPINAKYLFPNRNSIYEKASLSQAAATLKQYSYEIKCPLGFAVFQKTFLFNYWIKHKKVNKLCSNNKSSICEYFCLSDAEYEMYKNAVVPDAEDTLYYSKIQLKETREKVNKVLDECELKVGTMETQAFLHQLNLFIDTYIW